ncbi:class I SAM-dependent methyltransferase [Flavobacterium caeni]|uniref:Methyltransferase domain-containing protein n=1 Tax=Flavobacterium caeni TaxID=490189 RepID=A0A1G5JP69_9FLAO|nr:class I SAM-dependent methyltransferase [Flavobacterium caeni]SCY89701.1 Methyltransferase domain-containing protein [Flavobacterium caeni]
MKETEELLELNKRQKEFYNSTQPSKKNLPTRIWSNFRNGLLSDFRKKFDLKDRVYQEHKVWMGDLSDKKILDLGCLRGNALSLYMAENAKEYIGIDLSDVAIATLQQKIEAGGYKNAKAIAIDFFSPEFNHGDFDIVYAYGVLHHFENFDMLVARLKEKLKPGGIIVSYDPLETSLPIKVLRTLYRPFQNDADWEWPFTKKVIQKIKNNFEVEQVRGILGRSKYGVLINVLPLGSNYKAKIISKMIEKDWNTQNIDDIYSCMHVTLLLRK